MVKANLDYETKNSYEVTITATDSSGEDNDNATITVTIHVTDLDDAPTIMVYTGPPNNAPEFTDGDSTTRSVREGSAEGTDVGSPVAATDADEGDMLTYELGGTDAGSFAIDSASGQISVGEGTTLDDDVKDSYSVSVTVSDGEDSDSIEVTITVTPDNNAPEFTDGSSTTRSVAENAAAGAYVGDPVIATDADDDSLTYSDDSMYFDVNDDGQIMVAEGAMLDYEMDDMHTVTVTASDGEADASIDVTIMVTDMYPGCGTQGGDAANMYLNNDCEALLDSKDALGGSLNWDEAMPINDWDGIQGHDMFPSLSGDPMRVNALHLQKRGLDGMIPDALGRLSALTYLNLHSNTLDGMVPDALGMLTNLEVLYLNNNELDGTIGDLSGASSLEILWLKSNQLTGGIPASLGSLSNLRNLRLFNNNGLGGDDTDGVGQPVQPHTPRGPGHWVDR